MPFKIKLRSSNRACRESVATCGFDHRFPPSSTSSSNLIHLNGKVAIYFRSKRFSKTVRLPFVYIGRRYRDKLFNFLKRRKREREKKGIRYKFDTTSPPKYDLDTVRTATDIKNIFPREMVTVYLPILKHLVFYLWKKWIPRCFFPFQSGLVSYQLLHLCEQGMRFQGAVVCILPEYKLDSLSGRGYYKKKK